MYREDLPYKTKIASYFPQEPGLYAIYFDIGVKVGRSNNLSARVRSYLDPWCRDVLDFCFVKTPEYIRAEELAIEACQERWASVRGSRECFVVSDFRPIQRLINEAAARAEAQASADSCAEMGCWEDLKWQ